MHHVIPNAASNMVEIRLDGFAGADDVIRLENDLKGLFASGKLKPEYLMLVDTMACAVQSQAVLGAIADVVPRMPKAKRIAVISASAMIRLQLGRVLVRPYLRVVADRHDALGWLISSQEPRQAA